MNKPSEPTLKLESMPLRLWLRLLGCTRLMENRIRGNLRDTFDSTLPRFDVLAQLYRYPNGLRMNEISHLLMVTNGNITGIIDQLVREGLVERVPVPRDRRACIARLTPAGLAAFEDMAVQHRHWIDELMGGLTDEEQRLLHSLLTKLRDSVDAIESKAERPVG